MKKEKLKTVKKKEKLSPRAKKSAKELGLTYPRYPKKEVSIKKDVNTIGPQPGPQMQFLSCPADIVIYGGSAGGGKALKIDTPIPTPDGFKNIGDIVDGDRVFDEKGNICTVIKAWPIRHNRPCYEILFSDGETITCDEEHLWWVFSNKQRSIQWKSSEEVLKRRREKRKGESKDKILKRPDLAERNRERAHNKREMMGSVLETREMLSNAILAKGRANYSIPLCKPLILPDRKFSIHPYMLGVWLGDGLHSSGIISKKFDSFVLEELNKLEYETIPYKNRRDHRIVGLTTLLRSLGVLENKHIPSEYLRGSVDQRLALIHGLMDTDGTVSKKDGGLEFDNTNLNIVEGMKELLNSLGIKTSKISSKIGKLNGKEHKICYRLQWQTETPMFRLPRKLEYQKRENFRSTNNWRYIKSITQVESVPVRCLTVDSPSHLFLCGKGMIPTHNSFGLLLDPLRYAQHKNFGAVILRRTFGEIKKIGGLWDEAIKLYLPLGARPRESDLSFRFPSGATISFHHLQHEKDIYSWQGSQVPYIGFDELTHFTPRQFWYLTSRQRNVEGIPNLMRATCNPDPDSFVRQLIDWWIDESGFAIQNRSGHIRWFVRVEEDLIWADNREELLEMYPRLIPRSITFIAAKLADNQILMQKDPGYLTALLNLPSVDRGRLLDGNWNVRPASGLYFKRNWFEVVSESEVPAMTRIVRGWDLAGTPDKKLEKQSSKDPAATAGVKLGKDIHNNIWVLDMRYERVAPLQVERMVVNCATQDGVGCTIRLPQDPGQAGKAQIAHFAKLLLGFNYRSRVMTGDKITRAGPFSSASENGLVKVVRAPWNETFFNHLEQFPPEIGSPDIVDACVEAFHELTGTAKNIKRVAPVSVTV